MILNSLLKTLAERYHGKLLVHFLIETRILVHFQFRGGLGNQLFQLSYIYFFLSKTNKKRELNWEMWESDSRVCEIEELLVSSTPFKDLTAKPKTIESLSYNVRKRYLKWFHPLCILRNSLLHIILKLYVLLRNATSIFKTNLSIQVKNAEVHERRECVFAHPPKFLGKIDFKFIGFFQHWKYADYAWNFMKVDVIARLKKTADITEELNLGAFRVVIHIRGGDYLSLPEVYVNLGVDYYLRAISFLDDYSRFKNLTAREFLVITDDLHHAENICQFLHIPNSQIVGPNRADAWQTLKLMTHADVVISANSTLSWWGGFIAKKISEKNSLEKESEFLWILPNQWRSKESSHKALLHPSSLVCVSYNSASNIS